MKKDDKTKSASEVSATDLLRKLKNNMEDMAASGFDVKIPEKQNDVSASSPVTTDAPVDSSTPIKYKFTVSRREEAAPSDSDPVVGFTDVFAEKSKPVETATVKPSSDDSSLNEDEELPEGAAEYLRGLAARISIISDNENSAPVQQYNASAPEAPISDEPVVDTPITDKQENDTPKTETPILTSNDSDMTVANAAEELDDTDIKLMGIFGMDDELESTVGFDKVKQIEDTVQKEVSYDSEDEDEKGSREPRIKLPAEPEFTSLTQVKDIFKKYRIRYNLGMVRTLICLVLMVVLFTFENIGIFGGALPSKYDAAVYPVVHIMVDLQITLLCFALIYKQLIRGIISILTLKPLPESINVVLLLLTVIYSVIISINSAGENIRMYGFPVALCVFLALLFELMNLKREIYSFNIVSSKRIKYSIGHLDPRGSELETEAFYEYLPESPSLFRVNKASFIDGFVRRNSSVSGNKFILKVILPLITLLAIIFYIIGITVLGDSRDAVSVAYLTVLFGLPFSAFISYSLPFYKASKTAFDSDSAIIGDESLDEYTEASAVTFDDRDVFPSFGVKVRSVKVYGNNRIDHIVYNAASIFRVVGGPLSDVFDVATMDLGHSDIVEIISVDNDGVNAMVDNRHVCVGKADYLRRNGYTPITDNDDETVESSGEISIMYMVCGEDVAAKLYIQYHIDPDFEFILKKMYKAGICVGIKTLDPNIDDHMLSLQTRLNKYPVRVLKCKETNRQPEPLEHVDSGIVSKSSVKSLLSAFTLCDKVRQLTKANIIVSVFSAIIGIILMSFLVALKIPSVSSFYIALYQLFWILPMLLISKLFI